MLCLLTEKLLSIAKHNRMAPIKTNILPDVSYAEVVHCSFGRLHTWGKWPVYLQNLLYMGTMDIRPGE